MDSAALIKAQAGPGSEADSPGIHARTSERERELVDTCLNAVERQSQNWKNKGLNKANFVFGVSNSLFVAWSFGAIPQNFWIVYLVEVAILFPIRWRHQVNARPKEHLYWLDFCWIANFSAVLVLLSLAFLDLDDDTRKTLFSAAWGIGNGPLLMATGVLGNMLLFHDVNNTSSVLIHLFPSLVLFVQGWHHDQVHAAWPGIFSLDYFEHLDPWRDIYCNAALGYTGWWVAYTAWLLVWGMRTPAAGYDTIFHYNMRAGAGTQISRLLGRSKEEHKRRSMDNDFTRVDALVYMLFHAVAVYIAILVSLICFLSKWIHMALCGLMVLMTINNAASRYTYYMLESSGRVIRKELGIPLNRKASALI